MHKDRVFLWYGLCAVVGASWAWGGGLLVSVAVIGVIVVFGAILANIGDRPEHLPIHHAVLGLGVCLALSRVLPIVFYALGPDL